MKQNIDLAQLLDLSEEHKLNLISYLPAPDDFANLKSKRWNKQLARETTIGQMLEIVQSKVFKLELYQFKAKWRIILWHGGPNMEFEAEELCDCLWEAVKIKIL